MLLQLLNLEEPISGLIESRETLPDDGIDGVKSSASNNAHSWERLAHSFASVDYSDLLKSSLIWKNKSTRTHTRTHIHTNTHTHTQRDGDGGGNLGVRGNP